MRLRGRNTLARHEGQERGGKLGVSRIVGVGSARTQVRDVPGQGERRLDRIHRDDVVLSMGARQVRHQVEKH